MKSFTSAPSVQLPSRPLRAVKCIYKINTVPVKNPLSKSTSHDLAVKVVHLLLQFIKGFFSSRFLSQVNL